MSATVRRSDGVVTAGLHDPCGPPLLLVVGVPRKGDRSTCLRESLEGEMLETVFERHGVKFMDLTRCCPVDCCDNDLLYHDLHVRYLVE